MSTTHEHTWASFVHSFHVLGRIWDRGALVALRPEDREDYVRVCDSVLAPGGKILLATLVYDQAAKTGLLESTKVRHFFLCPRRSGRRLENVFERVTLGVLLHSRTEVFVRGMC